MKITIEDYDLKYSFEADIITIDYELVDAIIGGLIAIGFNPDTVIDGLYDVIHEKRNVREDR